MDLSFPFTHSLTYAPLSETTKALLIALHAGTAEQGGEGNLAARTRRKQTTHQQLPSIPWPPIIAHHANGTRADAAPLLSSRRLLFFPLCTTAITTSHARPSGPARAALVVAMSRTLGGEGTSQPGQASLVMGWRPRLRPAPGPDSYSWCVRASE